MNILVCSYGTFSIGNKIYLRKICNVSVPAYLKSIFAWQSHTRTQNLLSDYSFLSHEPAFSIFYSPYFRIVGCTFDIIKTPQNYLLKYSFLGAVVAHATMTERNSWFSSPSHRAHTWGAVPRYRSHYNHCKT